MRLEDEVVVVRHEAVGEAGRSRSSDRTLQAVEELEPIGVEGEDCLAVTPARVDVVDAAGDEVAG